MSKRNIRPQESGVGLRENLRLSVNFTVMQAIPDVEFKKQIVDQKIIEQPDYALIKETDLFLQVWSLCELTVAAWFH